MRDHHTYPDFVSGGQKQRAAIGRELAMHRDILLFGEVTSALDPELVQAVLQVMRRLAEDGTAESPLKCGSGRGVADGRAPAQACVQLR